MLPLPQASANNASVAASSIPSFDQVSLPPSEFSEETASAFPLRSSQSPTTDNSPTHLLEQNEVAATVPVVVLSVLSFTGSEYFFHGCYDENASFLQGGIIYTPAILTPNWCANECFDFQYFSLDAGKYAQGDSIGPLIQLQANRVSALIVHQRHCSKITPSIVTLRAPAIRQNHVVVLDMGRSTARCLASSVMKCSQ